MSEESNPSTQTAPEPVVDGAMASGVHAVNESISDSAPVITSESPEFNIHDITPSEFRDKAYLKDVNSVEALFKKLDGAQNLIGKKEYGIPDENAGQDKWDAFYKSVGRPEDSNGYDFDFPEAPEGFSDGLKKMFFDAGVSESQAAKLSQGYAELSSKYSDQPSQGPLQSDTDFDAMAAKAFGEREQTVFDNSKALMNQFTTPEMKQHVDNLPNEALIIMSMVLDGVQQKYIGEDNIVGMSDSARSDTVRSLSDQWLALVGSAAYTDGHSRDHMSTVSKANELNARISKLKNSR